MIAKRHLSAAPIKEALIDIQVALPEKVNAERLISEHSQISDRYPKSEQMYQGEFRFRIDRNLIQNVPVDSSNNPTIVGCRYITDDRRNIVQFRVDGFTFSRLESYNSWDELKQEAVRLWESYSNSVSPSLITRIATRYINLLKLPRDSEIKEYLAAPPMLPEGVDQKISRFFTRIETEMPSIDAQGLVTQGWDGGNDSDMTVLLDIEVYIEKQFDPQNVEFWDCFDQLREFKNNIFFNSITERTAELYQ